MPPLHRKIRVKVIADTLPHAGREGWLTETLSFLGSGIVQMDDGGELSGNYIVISLERLESVEGHEERSTSQTPQ